MRAKLLLSFLLFLSFFQISAQEYHPLLNNSWWILSDWVSCCRQPYVRTLGPGTDVVIGEYTYKKFIDPFPKWSVNPAVLMDTIYLREDIEARKVYKIVNGEDFLLYDFSLQQGDFITVKEVLYQASVDEVPVGDGMRKRITLESVPLFNGSHVYQRWIEGVGSNAHPFYPDHFLYADAMSSGGGYRVYTKCSFQDNQFVYGNPEFCGTAAMLGVDESAINNPNIIFSPNPFASELTIESPSVLQNAAFKLYNVQGQLVRETRNLSGYKITIHRENLSRGVYFVQLYEDGKLLKSDKILVD